MVGAMRTMMALLFTFCASACDSSDESSAPKARRAPAEPEAQVYANVEAWQANALVQGPVTQRFAVYALPGGKTKLATIARAKAEGFTIAENLDALKPGQLAIASPPITDFAPPDARSLEFMGKGLSPAEIEAVQKSSEVVTLSMRSEPIEAGENHLRVLKLAAAIAADSDGLVWDEDTRQLFSKDAWASRLEHPPNDPRNQPFHFTVHMYREGELLRMVTLGLAKFGLPDIVMEDVPHNATGPLNTLINALSVQMAVDGVLQTPGRMRVDPKVVYGDDAPSGAAPVTLSLAKTTADEGDPDNRLVQIVFPGPADRLFERQLAAAETLAPTGDDIVTLDHDEELLKASAQAKTQLLAMRKEFADGVPDMSELAVKAPFATTSGGTEWMWVSVTSWKGDTIRGVLDNEPYDVPSLEHGSKVEVKESSIFDFVYRKADGTELGGKTVEIMLRRQGK